MKKTLLATAILASLAFSGSAFAADQSFTASLVNKGAINNTIATSATAGPGAGASYSSASGTAGASSSGYVSASFSKGGSSCVTTMGSVAIGGLTETHNNGVAFNVSSGSGTGSASSTGWADASLYAKASYAGPGQSVGLEGAIDSGSLNHMYGTDILVNAGKNQGGFADATTTGSFGASGYVGSTICHSGVCSHNPSINANVFGSVSDSKDSVSTANTGTVNVVNVGVLQQAPVNASASTVVNVNGSFTDPV